MLKLTWTETGLEDLEWWHQHNSKMLKRIIQLCLATCKNPTQGIGKPEPLKFNLQGYRPKLTPYNSRTSFDLCL